MGYKTKNINTNVLIINFIKSVLAIIIAYMSKKKNIWLISERANDAKDSGFILFRYIRSNYPEIPVVYAINSKCKDFDKINNLGDWVEFGSLRHYILYIQSRVVISTQMSIGKPGGIVTSFLEKKKIIKVKSVFLQHGITQSKAKFLYYKNSLSDLFICGARNEYDFVIKTFGYPEGSVQYLGLCRFDNLQENAETPNQILIMPTWRNWLVNNESDFINSSFFINYQSLLMNQKLISYLEGNNVNIIFYLHNDFQKYIDFFTSVSKNIQIAKPESHEISDLLKQSRLLITDYSSVFFDFAYMKKPLIYYQFDHDEFRMKQYCQGYFDYNRDGFGPVIMDSDEVVNKIIDIASKNFNLDKYYSIRVDNFFELRDNDNCYRNFKAIVNLLEVGVENE